MDRYRLLYPEHRYVFLGDSGQGDALLAARLMAERASVMRGVFIRNILPTDAQGRAAWAAKGGPLFDTYVGAALHAFELGLISREGLARVACAARDEVAAIAFPNDRTRAARRAEVQRDVARVNERLPEGERVR